MKICTKCKVEKELTEFSTNKKAIEGLHSWCKECVNVQRRAKKYKTTEAGKEYRKQYDKEKD